MPSELNIAIDEAVEAALGANDLKQTHALLKQARDKMRGAEIVSEVRHAVLAEDIERVVVNEIEPLMWRIESRIRELASDD